MQAILHKSLDSCWYVTEPKGHKGMQSHSKNPKLPIVKAVYFLDASSIFICQNPDLRSKQEKCPALPNSPMPPVF